MKRQPLRTLLALALAFALATPALAQTQIRFYYGLGGEVGKLIEELVAEYNASQDDVEVTATFQGTYDETANKVMADLAAGTPPQIAQVSLANIPQFVGREGLLVDLNDFAEDPDLARDDLVDALVDAGTFDGRFVAMPFSTSTQLFYWNKDMFAAAGLDPNQPPQTWDELRSYANTIAEHRGSPTGFAAFGSPFEHWLLEYFFWANGASVLNEDADAPAFDSPEAVEALEFIDAMVNVDASTTFLPYGEALELFTVGEAGMLIASTGSLGGLRNRAQFEFGAGHLPAGPEGKVTSLGGGFLVMFDSAPEIEAATLDFLTFMVNTENTALMNIRTGYLPVRESAQESDVLLDFWAEVPQAQSAVTQLPFARARSTHPRLKEIHDILARMMSQAITENAVEPQQALEDAAREARQALRF